MCNVLSLVYFLHRDKWPDTDDMKTFADLYYSVATLKTVAVENGT